jgi:hypothetical protein
LKKIPFLLASIAVLAFILSGCFNTQSMVSYEFNSQSTPASVLHVYVSIKSITTGDMITTYPSHEKVDLVSNDAQTLISNIGVNVPFSIDHVKFSLDPTATVVYTDDVATVTRTFHISNASDVESYFYSYSTQQFEKAPFKINSVGQNKIIMVLWNLSNFSTPSTTNLALNGISLDKDELVKLKMKYKAPFNGPYFAKVTDAMNTFEFTKRCGEDNYDTLNGEYVFTLYPFSSPASTYKANVSVNTATQTLASTEINIGSDNIALTLP